jgi:hypothetical protein
MVDKIYSDVTHDNDKGIRKRIWFAFFIFIHFVDSNLTCPENHREKDIFSSYKRWIIIRPMQQMIRWFNPI